MTVGKEYISLLMPMHLMLSLAQRLIEISHESPNMISVYLRFGSLFPNSSSNSILSSNPNPQHIHILMPTLTTAPESVMILVSPHDPVGQTQLSV